MKIIRRFFHFSAKFVHHYESARPKEDKTMCSEPLIGVQINQAHISMHTVFINRHSAYNRLQSTVKIVHSRMWYVDIYFFLFRIRHAIIQNVPSARAVIPLLLSHVRAEIVTMTITLQYSVIEQSQKGLKKLVMWMSSVTFELKKQATKAR